MFFDEPFGGIIPGALGAVLSVLLRTDAPLTGREIHRLAGQGHSLWSVQQAIRTLGDMGLVETQSVGRAGVTTINENHVAAAALRRLLDPIALLREAISEVVDNDVSAVILFGSIARGEATPSSDIDLAVIAPRTWRARTQLEDHVRARLGNDCDIVVFTARTFAQLASSGEPVVGDIMRDGVALIGGKPRVNGHAA
jgi:predicted nucleotidyltransferase